jgi:glycosyltransferase involved in cell wall biosynthesis
VINRHSALPVKATFIAWASNPSRSELLAQHLGATMHQVYGAQRGLRHTPARYIAQARQTWQILHREQPDVVLVQNPPIFATLVAAAYARRSGARYIIDSHTGAFVSPKWRWALPLHRALSRDAITTIVTNDQLKSLVNSWGCRAFVLAFTPGDYPAGERFPLGAGFNVAVINTFSDDEPLHVVFDAARRLPDINFYVTGDARRIDPALLARKPTNCHLTGYLPYEQYIGLLKGVDVITDLTTYDHTLLMGAFEGISLGTPLVISDWPVLRDYFPRGTVHVPNTVDGVYLGIRRAQRDLTALKQDVHVMRDQLQAEWQHKFRELSTLVVGA